MIHSTVDNSKNVVILGPGFQSNLSLTILLKTNPLTVVGNVFSNALICLLLKCE